MKTLIIAMTVILFLLSGPAVLWAKPGGERKSTPSGWEHGKKKGWDDKDTPPGYSKGEKKGWDDESKPRGLDKKDKEEGDEEEDD